MLILRAFDTPGFIAGYVRSYARYLNMDPDWAFDTFCRESGFATAHGMSAKASLNTSNAKRRKRAGAGKDIFSSSTTPFIPAGEAMLSRIEPGAVGSVAVSDRLDQWTWLRRLDRFARSAKGAVCPR